ncbi:tRNA-dihydrouridine synthase, partial [Roseicyclus amphidinii]|uniref:tRNA-dihydrouridine synthase n=1 Tax=Roseicyclus amphidinii TaxID=3034232 RepID=UPI0024E05C0D
AEVYSDLAPHLLRLGVEMVEQPLPAGQDDLLAEIAAALHGTPAPVVPEGDALAEMVARHYEAMLGFYGRDLGLRVARKHLGWYMDEAGTEAALRRAVLTARAPDEVLARLPEALCPAARRDAA